MEVKKRIKKGKEKNDGKKNFPGTDSQGNRLSIELSQRTVELLYRASTTLPCSLQHILVIYL